MRCVSDGTHAHTRIQKKKKKKATTTILFLGGCLLFFFYFYFCTSSAVACTHYSGEGEGLQGQLKKWAQEESVSGVVDYIVGGSPLMNCGREREG